MASKQVTKSIFFHISRGASWVWVGGMATAMVLAMFLTLLSVVLFHGLRAFWTSDFETFVLKDGRRVLGAITEIDEKMDRFQLFIGNRELYGLDFTWIQNKEILSRERDPEVVVLERSEKGRFIGWIRSLHDRGTGHVSDHLWVRLKHELNQLSDETNELALLRQRISSINMEIEQLKQLPLKGTSGEEQTKDPALQRTLLLEAFDELTAESDKIMSDLRQRKVILEDAQGQTHAISLIDIEHAYQPNQLGISGKADLYLKRVIELFTASPRESNTEGGLFPAIFGTVILVLMMSLFCMPPGVMAAIFLNEYAREGMIVNLIRITVNNLAGVPSIVYGIFGLGFFVYGIGGSLDQLFYSDHLPLPTFGTDGLLWASLTMALLTVPVVIVATEEGLRSVPGGVREGSLAMGATQFQTLVRVVLPMASPGILTGLILAITRAAGEVAPLMLVGVVKMAPSLPVDGEFPFLHLDRKIMHLGFHIYDLGFQSPNVEAARPMVYVTTLLLLSIVLCLSLLAMYLRNKMKKRFGMGVF